MCVTSFGQAVATTWSPAEAFPRVPQWTVDRVYAGLHVADALLRELGIPYFALCGTLLGAVRHGGLIPWDVDGDLGIRAADISHLLREAPAYLADRGFGLGREHRFGLVKIFPLDGHKVRPWHPFRFPYVDIFPLMQRPNGSCTYASPLARRRWPREYFEDARFDALHTYQFGPLQLTAPTPDLAHRYLDSSYGRTWRTEAHFDPYRVSGLRHLQPAVITDFPPALPTPGLVEH